MEPTNYNLVLNNMSKNSQMKSSYIQNDNGYATTKETIKVTMKDIRDELFAILIHELCNVSFKEKMTLVLWFVNSRGVAVEMFNVIKHVDDPPKLSFKTTIYSPLTNCIYLH